MNYKATAILVVVALALASVGAVVLSDHAQAADSDEVYNQGDLQVTSDGATRTFQVNEQQFAGYVYVLTWKVGTVTGTGVPGDTSSWTTIITSNHSDAGSPPSFTDVESGATVDDNGSQFTVKMNDVEGVVGKYELSVESTASAGAKASIGLQCQIEVTIGGIEKTLAEVKGKLEGITSLEDAAKVLGVEVERSEGLSLASTSTDPALLGAAQSAPEGTLCGPVAGTMGVYVLNVSNRQTGSFYTEDDARNLAAQKAQYSAQLILSVMADYDDVVDNRARFF